MDDREWRKLFHRWWRHRLLAILPGLWWGATICVLVASDGRFRWSRDVIWSDIFIALGFLALAALVFVPIHWVRKVGYILNLSICTLSIPLAIVLILYHQLHGFDRIGVILAAGIATALWWPAFYEYPLELRLIAGLSNRPTPEPAVEEFETNPGWDHGQTPEPPAKRDL